MSARRKAPRRSSGDPASRPVYVAAGVFATFLAILALVIAFLAPTSGIPGQRHYTLDLEVASLENLGTKGAEVRIAGKRVGQTVDGRLVGGVPTITLRLDSSVRPLPSDTRARVRLRGLLGAEYVQLTPGRSTRTLPEGGTIGLAHSSAVVQIPDVLDTFDEPTRTQLGRALRGLGGGVVGRGEDLNAALGVAPTMLHDFSAALYPLLDRPGSTTRLVAGADALMAALFPVREDLPRGFRSFAAVARAFTAEAPSFQRTLDLLPGTLSDVRAALARTDPLLASATRLADATTSFTAAAPAALRGTNRLLLGARQPLGATRTLLRDLRRAVPSTVALARTARPVLPELDAVIRPTRTLSRGLGARGCRVEALGRNWRSMLGFASKGQRGPLGPMTMVRLDLQPPVTSMPGLLNVRPLPARDPTNHDCPGGGR